MKVVYASKLKSGNKEILQQQKNYFKLINNFNPTGKTVIISLSKHNTDLLTEFLTQIFAEKRIRKSIPLKILVVLSGILKDLNRFRMFKVHWNQVEGLKMFIDMSVQNYDIEYKLLLKRISKFIWFKRIFYNYFILDGFKTLLHGMKILSKRFSNLRRKMVKVPKILLKQ